MAPDVYEQNDLIRHEREQNAMAVHQRKRVVTGQATTQLMRSERWVKRFQLKLRDARLKIILDIHGQASKRPTKAR